LAPSSPPKEQNHLREPHRHARSASLPRSPEVHEGDRADFTRRRRLAGLLALGLLTALCLAGLALGEGSPEREREPEREPSGERRAAGADAGREGRGSPQRATGRYDRGQGWERLDLDVTLVDARVVDGTGDALPGHSRPGRSIAAEFRIRNRSSSPTDERPHLVAVDRNGRQHHGPEEAPVTEPSVRELQIDSKGTKRGYLSVLAPDGATVERIELKIAGQSLGWDLERAL
jgi:hypothetical protein